jgi:hypothetical protein
MKQRSKERIFIYLKISEIMRNSTYDGNLNENDGAAWIALKAENSDFLGRVKAENYESLVKELLNSNDFTGYRI